jgi:hypothetical protein
VSPIIRVGLTPAQLASIALTRTERRVAFFITRRLIFDYLAEAAPASELVNACS